MKNYNTYITKLIAAIAVILTLTSFTSIANDKSSQDLCLETYPRWMFLSGDGNFKVGDTISSNTGVKAIITSYNAESHFLNYYHKDIFEEFENEMFLYKRFYEFLIKFKFYKKENLIPPFD